MPPFMSTATFWIFVIAIVMVIALLFGWDLIGN